jgi:hypothetical protein
MAKYKGWTNYETWKAKTEYYVIDEKPSWLDNDILKCYKKGKWDKDALEDVISELTDSYIFDINNTYEDIDNTFVQSVFLDSMKKVNFQEIAENIIDNYKESLI